MTISSSIAALYVRNDDPWVLAWIAPFCFDFQITGVFPTFTIIPDIECSIFLSWACYASNHTDVDIGFILDRNTLGSVSFFVSGYCWLKPTDAFIRHALMLRGFIESTWMHLVGYLFVYLNTRVLYQTCQLKLAKRLLISVADTYHVYLGIWNHRLQVQDANPDPSGVSVPMSFFLTIFCTFT